MCTREIVGTAAAGPVGCWAHIRSLHARPQISSVGALHTLVNSDKATPLEKDPTATLQLSWSWSARDVAAVTNVVLLGATFTAVSGAGNEPHLTTSFAAGLALRMSAYELLPAKLWAPLTRALKAQALEFVGVDAVAARAGSGVGSCAGGPFRATLGWLGWLELPWAGALAAKVALLLLPILATAQWGLRTVGLLTRLRKELSRQGRPARLRTGEFLAHVLRRRLIAAAAMTIVTSLLVVYYATYELNAVNGSLGNLLTLALVGCILESLLSTYEVRGRLRSALFFFLFMLL